MSDLRIGSLFSGYGGLDMAVRATVGGRVVWHSDLKPAACELLAHRHPEVPNLGDMTAIDYAAAPPIDVLAGSWPCQPHSSAGKRLGEADPRALWPHVARAIAATRPLAFFGENVARIAGNGELRRVVRSLADLGYVGAWRCVRASDVGAPHRRDRCFVVALRADVAADPSRLVVRDEPGRRGGPGGSGAGVVGDDGAQRSVRLTLLPTPTQSMTTGAGTSGRDGGLNLQTAVTLLPTPTVNDSKNGRNATAGRSAGEASTHHSGWTLSDVAHAERFGKYADAIARWTDVLGRSAPAPTMPSAKTGNPQLAPALVEWMMGLPDGHVTDIPGLTRAQMLSLLGDGVVPQQGAYAFAGLLDALTAERAA